MTEYECWEKFLKEKSLDQEAKFAGSFGFEAKGFAGTERIAALLAGRKTAAFFSFATFAIDNEELPVSDEYYIVLDANHEAVCVIKTTAVQILPYDQVTWEMAAREGEDSSLQDWRERTRENLEDEAAVVGFEFAPDIKLVYMEFEVASRV